MSRASALTDAAVATLRVSDRNTSRAVSALRYGGVSVLRRMSILHIASTAPAPSDFDWQR